MERHPQALLLCAYIFITFVALLRLVEAQDQTGIIFVVFITFCVELLVPIHFAHMCY